MKAAAATQKQMRHILTLICVAGSTGGFPTNSLGKRKQKRKGFPKWKETSANCKRYFVASVTAL
jgi:hypothetical protein